MDLVPAEGLNLELGLLLAVLDDTTLTWRQMLGDLSPGALDWQPFPGGHSIGAILLHMANIEAKWLHEVASGQPRDPELMRTLLFDEIHYADVQWPAPPREPLSWFYAQQDVVRARTHQLLGALDDPLRLSMVGETAYTLRWLINHMISHDAYHGGQVVLLSLIQERQENKA